MKNKKQFLLFLAVLTLASTLVNHSVFGAPSMSAYFLFMLSASVLMISTAVEFIKNKSSLIITRPLPLYIFLVLTIYFIIQGYMMQSDGLTFRHLFLLVNCLLLFVFCILFSVFQLPVHFFYRVIILLAGMEAAVCLMQYAGWVECENKFFTVTGTWTNPNVTAMFLAMALPVVWWGIFKEKNSLKWISLSVLLMSLSALFLLSCRTAFIGGILATAIFFNARYGLLQRLKGKFSPLKVALFTGGALTLLIAFAFYLYRFKQASADGRMMVWKISLQMAAKKPLAGFGYGRFEHDYNLFQADYFAHGPAAESESAHASFVHMAYSEFMENAVEGGIIGLLFFAGLLVSLLIKPAFQKFIPGAKEAYGQSEKEITAYGTGLAGVAAYAGIVGFAVMSVFNFTVQAVPVMCLFVLYAAFSISSFRRPEIASKWLPFNHPFHLPASSRIFLALPLLLIAFFIGLSQASVAGAMVQNEKAKRLMRDGNHSEALQILSSLKDRLKDSENYWENYGMALFVAGKYKSALEKFEKAKVFTSDPNLYIMIGHCYNKMGMSYEAESAFRLAANMEPGRFAPRYALMKVYERTGDTDRLLDAARYIVSLKPKVPSPEVWQYKAEAGKILNHLNN